MLNLFIPSSKYQLEQFKLYTDNFKEELEDEIEKMYWENKRVIYLNVLA